MLPGSALVSTARHYVGETQSQRVHRMVSEDFGADPVPFPAAGVSALILGIQAVHLMRMAEWGAARELFAQAAVTHPDDPEALFNMGIYWEVAHEPDRMVRWMDAAIELHPGHCGAWVLRSKYMEHAARYEEALEGYRTVLRFEPNNSLAAGQYAGIVGHRKVHIEPVGARPEALQLVLEHATPGLELPAWQENFLHPRVLPALRQPLLEGPGVMAWDNVLSEELLSKLDESVDHYFQFVFTNGWVYSDGTGKGNAATTWLPAASPACTAPELAARVLLRKLVGEDPQDFAGVEFWGRVRAEDLGAALHYDQAEDDVDVDGTWLHGNPWRPRWSSVLYLTDEGGPTVVVEQVHTHEGRLVPGVPLKGHCAMPRRNRWMVFRGDLFHGTLPVELTSARLRKVFIFNFWHRHTPAPPHCQRVDYKRHQAMQRLELSAAELELLESAEMALPRPLPVPRQVFRTLDSMPHRTTLGYLPQALPLPTAEQLRSSSGLCQFRWSEVAGARGAGSAAMEGRDTWALCGLPASPIFYEAAD